MTALDLARTIVQVLEEKKGEDILLLDIQGLTTIADYFVICSGTSERMLRALADSVATEIKEKHQFQARLEGLAHEGWVLADCGDVIVHLLSPQRRNYYRLEELWSKGKILLRLQ